VHLEAASLIRAATDLGVQLAVVGDRLCVQPVAKLPAELRRALRERKPEIIEALRGPVGTAAVTSQQAAVSAVASGSRSALDRARADLQAIQGRRSRVGLIGPPSPNLIVRGLGLAPKLVPAVAIPVAVVEYHVHGNLWRPIPEHWRTWWKKKFARAA
jgi:hypothetical protein